MAGAHGMNPCEPRLAMALVAGLAIAATAQELTLDQALQMAYDRSPTMLQARHGLEISRRNLSAQRAALRSRFLLTVTPYQHARDRVFNELISGYNTQELKQIGAVLAIQQPIELTDGTFSVEETVGWREASSSFVGQQDERTYNSSLQLRLHHPLFTYNRTRLELRELELSLENARLNYAVQKLQIESQVVRQFLDVYLQQRNVAISDEELANAGEWLQIIRSKVEAGTAAVEELYQAELDEANARASAQDNRLQLESALDDLRLSLAAPLESRLTVLADISKHLVHVDLDAAIAHGLERRMELRQSAIEIENARHQLVRTDAQNEFYGSVDLTYGIVGTDQNLGDVYGEATRNQRIAVMLNVPLFDWGEKEHRMAAVREQIASRELSADDQRRGIAVEIRKAYRALRNQEMRIEIAEKNVEKARAIYAINLERYRNGDLSSKDMNFYQSQLSREQLNEAGALINYQLALLDLKVRTLWDFVLDAPVEAVDPEL